MVKKANGKNNSSTLGNSSKPQANETAYYNEQQILKVWDVYVKTKNLKYWFSNTEVGASVFENPDSMKLVKESGLLLNKDGTLFVNESRKSVSVSGPVDHMSYANFLGGYNGITNDITIAFEQIKTWNLSAPNQQIAAHTIIFPYHNTPVHWGLGVLSLNFNAQHVADTAIIELYNPLPEYGGIKIPDEVREEILISLRKVFEVPNITLNNPEKDYPKQQKDGTSCGVISAENGKDFIDGSTVRVSIPYETGTQILRARHLADVSCDRFNKMQRDDEGWQDPKFVPPSNIRDIARVLFQSMTKANEDLDSSLQIVEGGIPRAQFIRNIMIKKPEYFTDVKLETEAELFTVLFYQDGQDNDLKFKDGTVDILKLVTSHIKLDSDKKDLKEKIGKITNSKLSAQITQLADDEQIELFKILENSRLSSGTSTDDYTSKEFGKAIRTIIGKRKSDESTDPKKAKKPVEMTSSISQNSNEEAPDKEPVKSISELVQNGHKLIVLTGPNGIGKTKLLANYVQSLLQEKHTDFFYVKSSDRISEPTPNDHSHESGLDCRSCIKRITSMITKNQHSKHSEEKQRIFDSKVVKFIRDNIIQDNKLGAEEIQAASEFFGKLDPSEQTQRISKAWAIMTPYSYLRSPLYFLEKIVYQNAQAIQELSNDMQHVSNFLKLCNFYSEYLGGREASFPELSLEKFATKAQDERGFLQRIHYQYLLSHNPNNRWIGQLNEDLKSINFEWDFILEENEVFCRNKVTGQRKPIQKLSLSSGQEWILGVVLWKYAVEGEGKGTIKTIILDEPDRHLDPKLCKKFVEIIKKAFIDSGITVVLTTHRVDTVALIDDRLKDTVTGRSFNTKFTIHSTSNPNQKNEHGLLPTHVDKFQDMLRMSSSAVVHKSHNDELNVNLKPVNKLQAMFRMTSNLRDITGYQHKVYTEELDDAYFYEAVYKGLRSYCTTVRDQAKTQEADQDGNYNYNWVIGNESYRILSQRCSLAFYSASASKGDGGGCNEVKKAAKRDANLHQLSKKGLINEPAMHRACAILDSDYGKDHGVDSIKEGIFTILKRHSVESFIYDPLLLSSLVDDNIPKQCKEIKRLIDEPNFDQAAIQREAQEYFKSLVRSAKSEKGDFNSFLSEHKIGVKKKILEKKWSSHQQVQKDLAESFDRVDDSELHSKDKYLEILKYANAMITFVRSKMIPNYSEWKEGENWENWTEQAHWVLTALKENESFGKFFFEKFESSDEYKAIQNKPDDKQKWLLYDIVKPWKIIHNAIITSDKDNFLWALGHENIPVICGVDKFIVIKYPKLFLQMRGHDINTDELKWSISKNGIITKLAGSNNLFIPLDLAQVFFKLNDQVIEHVRKETGKGTRKKPAKNVTTKKKIENTFISDSIEESSEETQGQKEPKVVASTGLTHIIATLESEIKKANAQQFNAGEIQIHQAVNATQLDNCLQDIKSSDKKHHFVIMSVDKTGEPTEGNTDNDNHWTGVYIRKTDTKYKVKYVNSQGWIGGIIVSTLEKALNVKEQELQNILFDGINGNSTLIELLAGAVQDGNNLHLKRTEKAAGEVYDIREFFTAINSNLDLLDKLSKQAVVTADIDLKAVEVKNDVAPDKVGKVEFLAESSHIQDHAKNTKSLMERMESGDIGKDTVIAIERKSYGQNLGVPDVIMLASIIEHNAKNPEKQLQIPEEITQGSLIYQDAILYNTAKRHEIKVIGLEGKNLKVNKDSSEYDEAREDYMADRITQLISKGYNVIAYVGSAHVDNLKKALENKTREISEEYSNVTSEVSTKLDVVVMAPDLAQQEVRKSVIEEVCQETKEQAAVENVREMNIDSLHEHEPMSIAQPNIIQESTETMEEAWVQANQNAPEPSYTKQKEVGLEKEELSTMNTSWQKSQAQITKANTAEPMQKLPKITQQQQMKAQEQLTHVAQEQLATQLGLKHTLEKAVTHMTKKIAASAVQMLNALMYVDTYDVQDVLHSVASTGGCAAPTRPYYSPEAREIISQLKLGASGNTASLSKKSSNDQLRKTCNEVEAFFAGNNDSRYGNFYSSKTDKANDTLPPLGTLVDVEPSNG